MSKADNNGAAKPTDADVVDQIGAVFAEAQARVDARRDAPCSARFEPVNGETVTPCHLPSGHDGNHEGRCLGSACAWPQGVTCERELNEPNAALSGGEAVRSKGIVGSSSEGSE